MGNLNAFLKPKNDRTKDIFLKRFTDENGKVVPIKLKAVSLAQLERITKNSLDENGNTDEILSTKRLLLECIVDPCLKDKQLLEYYKVDDPLDIFTAMFEVKEYTKLVNEVQKICGMKSNDDLDNEAKNS